MKARTIVGVDVSKLTLDSTVLPADKSRQVTNNQKGFSQWKKWTWQYKGADSEVLVVMEHTGLYSHLFELFLQREGIGYLKKPAVEIKQSIGMTRGKSDRIDAKRIAQYGWLRKEELAAQQYPTLLLTEIKDLMSYRSKLLRDRSGYQLRLKEELETGRVKKADFLLLASNKKILLIWTVKSR